MYPSFQNKRYVIKVIIILFWNVKSQICEYAA